MNFFPAHIDSAHGKHLSCYFSSFYFPFFLPSTDKPGSPTGQLGDRPDKQDGEKRMQAKKDGDSKPADKSMKKDGTEKDNMGDTGRDGARNRDRPGGAREVTGMKSAQISSTETSSRPSSSESVKMALTFLAVGLASPESSGARTNRGWWPTRTCVTTTSIVLLRMMINPYRRLYITTWLGCSVTSLTSPKFPKKYYTEK